MKKIHIDFETRSEIDLTKCGAWMYSKHPSTDIMCIGWAVNEEEAEITVPLQFCDSLSLACVPWTQFAEIINKAIMDDEYVFEAHNAFFERCIWHNIAHKRWGLPDIPIRKWRCSAAKAAAHALPRALAKAALAIGLTNRKDEDGHSIMMQLCKKRKTTKHNPSEWHEQGQFADKFEKLFAYCKQDVVVERELSHRLKDLNETEQQVWFLDQLINTRGVYIDRDLCEMAKLVAEEHMNELTTTLCDLTNNEVTSISQIAIMLQWVNKKQNWRLDSLDKVSIEQLLKDPEVLLPEVKQVLEIRQAGAKPVCPNMMRFCVVRIQIIKCVIL